jgi:mRNA-degrading endonuclease toxin of MazEF toxin-antitoxin module
MPVNRGDVILTYVPNVGSPGGTVRPALVVQSGHNNGRLNETIIAAITSNTSRVGEAMQLAVFSSPDQIAFAPWSGGWTAKRLAGAADMSALFFLVRSE